MAGSRFICPCSNFWSRGLSGALIVADDLAVAPDALAAYVGYVRDGANGYVSVEVPLGDCVEVSVRAS
jgi:hypothetical protein